MTTNMNVKDAKAYLLGVTALNAAASFIFQETLASPMEVQNLGLTAEYVRPLPLNQIEAVMKLTHEQRRMLVAASGPGLEPIELYYSRAYDAFIVEDRRRAAAAKFDSLTAKDPQLKTRMSEYIELCAGILELRRLTGRTDITALIERHEDESHPVNLVELLNVVFRSQEAFTKEFVGIVADMFPQYGLVPDLARRWIQRQLTPVLAKQKPDIGTSPSDGAGKVFFWAQQLRPTTTQLKDCELACRNLLSIQGFPEDLPVMSKLHVNDLAKVRNNNPAYSNSILAVWKTAVAIDRVVHFDKPTKTTLADFGKNLCKPVTGMDGAHRAILVIGEAYRHFHTAIADQFPHVSVGDIVNSWEPDLIKMVKEFPESLFYTALAAADHEYLQPAKLVYEYLNPEIAMRREVARQLQAQLEPLYALGYLKRPESLPTLAEIHDKEINALAEFEAMVVDLETCSVSDLAGRCKEWLDNKHYKNAVNLLKFSNNAACETRMLAYPEGTTRCHANYLQDFLRGKAREHKPSITSAQFV